MTQAARPPIVAPFALRATMTLALTLAFLWLLADRWASIDQQALMAAFRTLGTNQWMGGLAFTAVSFWAVGRYDEVLHRHLGTKTPSSVARRAGICAIAVSQTVGFGLVSGAILRWRLVPGLSLWQATRFTALIAVSFLAAWAVVTAMVIVALPGAPFKPLAVMVLGLALGLIIISLRHPQGPATRVRWPNSFTLVRLFGLTLIDTCAACAALYVMVPNGLAIDVATLLPAFLLALGAGLVMGTPGGIGAFELCLITLLPFGQDTDLLAAILAWRMVYYAVPAVLGAVIALLHPAAQPAKPVPVMHPHLYDRAEGGLARQAGLGLEPVGAHQQLLGRTNHCLIALVSPLHHSPRGDIARSLSALARRARDESRMAVLYKTSARWAAVARAEGRFVRRIGWEASLDLSRYALGASSRSGLRRKLRRAEGMGVRVAPCTGETAPWAALDQIAGTWSDCHGGERGFSMGRHDKTYLQGQRLFVAWQDGKPIAYVSFHAGKTEWALDLMRHGQNLPDGTMHCLVQCAIEQARAEGMARLSLAAVPNTALGAKDRLDRLLIRLIPCLSAKGLYQFKQSFAPQWHPLYMATPHRMGLVLAGLALWRAITAPAPQMNEIEAQLEEIEFAPVGLPCHMTRDIV